MSTLKINASGWFIDIHWGNDFWLIADDDSIEDILGGEVALCQLFLALLCFKAFYPILRGGLIHEMLEPSITELELIQYIIADLHSSNINLIRSQFWAKSWYVDWSSKVTLKLHGLLYIFLVYPF